MPGRGIVASAGSRRAPLWPTTAARRGGSGRASEMFYGDDVFYTDHKFACILCLNSLTTWPREGGRLGKGADAEEEPAAAAEVDPRVW